MRLLQVVESAATGVGRHVMDLSGGLLERGDEVVLAYADWRMDRMFAEGLARLEPKGLKAIKLPFSREIGPEDLRSIRALRDLIRTHGPFDAVHGHSSKGGAVARVAARTVPRRLYTPHAYITMAPTIGVRKFRLYRALERYLARLGTGTVCVSHHEKAHAVGTLGIPAPTVHVVHNGVAGPARGDRESIRAELGVQEGDVAFGFVGRLWTQKNPLLAVDAFARLRAVHPEARLLMVGTGDLEDAIRARGVPGVELLGERNGPQTMHAFDAFVLPSDYEGFPYVTLEAMATGVPVISTETGAIGEAVRDGVDGFLVPPGDATALSGAMARLMADPALRARMGASARERAGSFTIDGMVEKIRTLYAG
ncbi:glycosyltransferase family 1 protein [bacterium]|nr:MAG: glycosyltransferase family 1 protein [bacterium]